MATNSMFRRNNNEKSHNEGRRKKVWEKFKKWVLVPATVVTVGSGAYLGTKKLMKLIDQYSKLPPTVEVMVSGENVPTNDFLEKTLNASAKPLNILESVRKGNQKAWEETNNIANLERHLIENLDKTYLYEDKLDKTKNIVESLKEKGVNLNAIKDENGNNLVKIAVMHEKWDKAKLFIKYGVNPLEKGKDGKSAVDILIGKSASKPRECLDVALAVFATTMAGALGFLFLAKRPPL